MIRPNGDVVATGRVILKHHNYDAWIIERAKLSHVFIDGPKLCWINQDDNEGRTTIVGSDWVCKIFDAIVFEAGDIVFVEQADPAGWTRMRGTRAGGMHPGNQK
jgi:hypothetical protein